LKQQWRRESMMAGRDTSLLGAGLRFEDSRTWKNDATQARLAKKVKKLNGQILNFNLAAPHMNFQKFFIDLNQEVAALE
jgi:hypothetical protein